MPSVCMLDQTLYEFDARVKRKAEALVSAGYTVDVLSLRAPGAKKTFVLNGVTLHTCPLAKKRSTLPRYVFEYAFFFFWALVKVPLLMRRRHYAVVEVNTLPDFLIFAAIGARWMGAKLVLDMHEITPEFYMSKYGLGRDSVVVRLLTFLERISFNVADHVITITDPIQDLLVSRGLSRQKSSVLMNSADEACFRPAHPPSTERASMPPAFAMMYHGTLTRIYGLDLAIEAFSRVHEQMPGAELWILGFGPEERALKTLVGDRNLTSKVKMPGAVRSKEVAAWLGRCDAGILPMRRDVFLDFAFPNKLSEFIVTKTPVLVSRLRTIRQYFSEEAVAYFEPHDIDDLAQQMTNLYRDREQRARFAAQARVEYDPIRWDVMKECYLTVLDGLIDPALRPVRTTAAGKPTLALEP